MAEFTNLENSLGLFQHQEFVRRVIAPHTPTKRLLVYHSLGSGKTITFLACCYTFMQYHKKCLILVKGDSSENNIRREMAHFEKISGKKLGPIEFDHFIRFANKKNHPDYSGYLIIIDEVHNMKLTELNSSSEKIRSTFHDVDATFLFTTATPIVNSVSEISYLEGLLNIEHHPTLQTFSGLVSYSNISYNKASVLYVSRSAESSTLCSYDTPMSEYQETRCRLKSKNIQFYNPNSLFAMDQPYLAPDNTILHDAQYLFHGFLPTHSATYSALMNVLATTEGKVFIFCERIKDCGCRLISAMLKDIGYKQYDGGPLLNREPRFIVCTADPSISPNMDECIEKFNEYDADHIRIIIGTQVIGEAVSLRNIESVHIVTMPWNIPTLNQVIGRATREGSHDDPNAVVRVYIHLPTSQYSSDRFRYESAISKYAEIQVVEKQLQECSLRITPNDDVDETFLRYYVDMLKVTDDLLDHSTSLKNHNILLYLARNNILYKDKYVRFTLDGPYLSSDKTSPVFSFPRLKCVEQDTDFITSRNADWRIGYLEQHGYKTLVFEYAGYKYHLQEYRMRRDEYSNSSFIPSRLDGSLRIFVNGEWKSYRDSRVAFTEKELCERFYDAFLAEMAVFPFFVLAATQSIKYISVNVHADRRKISRGRNIASLDRGKLFPSYNIQNIEEESKNYYHI